MGISRDASRRRRRDRATVADRDCGEALKDTLKLTNDQLLLASLATI